MAATQKWQDWASFALGLWLAVSPWMAGYAEHDAATANAVIVGLALALGSHFECVACDEAPAEWINLAVGLWLVCAPFTLGFASRVGTANSIVVGISVAALAVSALSLDKQIGKLWHRAH
ncbi:MAG TPA: SPW repeat protein [Burkholderiales bacterium]|nr:SPW repeat protein [Burkholderiales bacterium]